MWIRVVLNYSESDRRVPGLDHISDWYSPLPDRQSTPWIVNETTVSTAQLRSFSTLYGNDFCANTHRYCMCVCGQVCKCNCTGTRMQASKQANMCAHTHKYAPTHANPPMTASIVPYITNHITLLKQLFDPTTSEKTTSTISSYHPPIFSSSHSPFFPSSHPPILPSSHLKIIPFALRPILRLYKSRVGGS